MPGKKMRPQVKVEAGRGQEGGGTRAAAAAAAAAAEEEEEEVKNPRRRRRAQDAGVSCIDSEDQTEVHTLRSLTQSQALSIHDMQVNCTRDAILHAAKL